MAWRNAKSILTLRDQINAMAPRRVRSSDGTIGNAEHASRSSDHNPWVKDGAMGVVTAIDITHDPRNGCDANLIANALLHEKDRRIKYVIWSRRIFSNPAHITNKPGWSWRAYVGKNPHTQHFHLSVAPKKALYDSTLPWALVRELQTPPVAVDAPVVPDDPFLMLGARGEPVERLQGLLNSRGGASIVVDGEFGPATEKAVRAFQKAKRLVVDGKVGGYTWAALRAAA